MSGTTRLSINNFASANIRETTYVATDYSSGTALVVKSAQGIVADLYVLVGALGQEQTELRRIVTVTNNTLTLASALSNSHDAYTPVTVLNANQLRIYKATNVDGTVPADASFAILDTVDIDTDQLTTTYSDSAGGTDYWYKYTYYNQQTTAASSLSDAQASRGGANNHYAALDGIRQEAGLTGNIYISDVLIDEKRLAAEDEINAALKGTYDIPFDDPAPPQITHITELLAAGMLLTTDYGAFATGTNKDGNAKLTEARALLAKLQAQSAELVDASGNTLVLAGRVNGWPLNETATTEADQNGGDRLFRITDRY